MRYTLEDVANFCWKYKRHKGFKDHAYEQLGHHILWAADNHKLVIVEDSHGICGVCTFSDYPGRLYIHHIVAIRTGFATLVLEAEKRFPGYAIVGLRSSKLITFNKKILWATTLHRPVPQHVKS